VDAMPQAPAPYPVVNVRPEWLQDPDSMNIEYMGSKPKFWFQSNIRKRRLFKYPIRRDSGEHWAEKIASEVAGALGVSCARVELAAFENTPNELASLVGYRGSVSEEFTEENDRLIHGNELLRLVEPNYDAKATRFHQPHHTLNNIWSVFDDVFSNTAENTAAKRRFSEYLTLDALIGNTDRHHENWGLIIRYDESDFRIFIAPSFDHASSLGHGLHDRRRNSLLSEGRLAAYVARSGRRGSGGIYWSSDEHAPSPLELVRRAARTYPSLFDSSKARIQELDENSFDDIVRRIPQDWMTPPARELAVALLLHNLNELREILK